MDIRWLRTFVTAAKFENFRQTAERLYMAQPTVTVHIRHLEKEIGSPLFKRSGRNIVLTTAGHRFLPHAKKILAYHDQGLQDLLGWRQGYERKLTLAVSPLIAASILPYTVREFTERYPETEVRVEVAESKEIGEMTANGKADLGLSRIKPGHPNLEVHTLYEDPIVCVAPHDGGDFESSPPIELDDLLETMILFTHNHPGFWEALLADIRGWNRVYRSMVVTQVHVTKRFIEEGLGFSFLPKSTVRRELLEGRMLEARPKWLDLPTAATYLVSREDTEEVSQFKNFLGQYWP
ncbi:MAG TPA: LysR family transcriptional regulator [Bacillales bacterium]|nr:LysR family transcriptional regulator [Bacillales bacterium]